MRQSSFAGWLIVVLFSGKCFALDPMDERAARFASALNISTNAIAHVSSKPVFAGKETVKAGEFQVKKKRIFESQPGRPMDIDILDSNGQVVAAGRISEYASFEMAREALLKRLVLNSMGVDSLIRKYEVRSGEVGELCIVEKTFDKVTRKYTSEPAVIHFLRGCADVTLYSAARGKNLQAISKALDVALSEISVAEKPSTGNK